jgi:hypothetical protein
MVEAWLPHWLWVHPEFAWAPDSLPPKNLSRIPVLRKESSLRDQATRSLPICLTEDGKALLTVYSATARSRIGKTPAGRPEAEDPGKKK